MQDSTGYSPFQLLYGHQVRGPLTILKELWTSNIEDEEVKTTYQYVVDMRQRLEDTCKKSWSKTARNIRLTMTQKQRSDHLKKVMKFFYCFPVITTSY